MDTINGWLLVYLAGSVPLLIFYAMGLSGWYLDYPIGLFAVILIIFTVPLVLLVLKAASAPSWNIALLWIVAGLITVRVLHGLFMGDIPVRWREGLILSA